jgi:hypothetical protein
MVGVEHDDQIQARRGQLLLLRPEQPGDLAVRTLALHQMRKERRVRDAEAGNDLRHISNSCGG